MMAKLLHGIGYNSKKFYNPSSSEYYGLAHQTWRDMIKRCYNLKYQEKWVTYIGCEVDEDWHDFQVFLKWFLGHSYSGMGYQLDKDLLFPNNKIYSPRTCCFVPSQLNTILISCKSSRGSYPQGVNLHKGSGRYRASIRINGKKVHLGLFDSPEEAYQAYKIAKEAYVKEKALEWKDRVADDVFQALMNWTLDS